MDRMFKIATALLGLYTAHRVVDDIISKKESTAQWHECMSFRPLPGSDCGWMSDYCSLMVGPNHYFIDGVCSYYRTGWRGKPVETGNYTCCAIRREL